MKKFLVSFIYIEECYDDVVDCDSIEDVEHILEYEYESNAFYDNHYISDLEIKEIKEIIT